MHILVRSLTVLTLSALAVAGGAAQRGAGRQNDPNEKEWLPLFIASFGSVLKIWRSGRTPSSMPTTVEIAKPSSSKTGCGVTLNFIGYREGGCHPARPLSAIHERAQAHAPPTAAIMSASTRI